MVATGVRRRRTLAQQQAAIRQRTVDAADTTNWSNPVAGNTELREIELRREATPSSGSGGGAAPQSTGSVTGRDVAVQDMHVHPRRNIDGRNRLSTTTTTKTPRTGAGGEEKKKDRAGTGRGGH